MSVIKLERYRTALCPYLTIGNQRILIHLDAFGVPQSLQWPRPGSPDRLALRDPADEWPYWDEMSEEAIRIQMPYMDYGKGQRDYLHAAQSVAVDYLEDTNILHGRYSLPGGATVEIDSFVMPHADVWVRHYRVAGHGRFVLQGDFFRRAVRGHSGSNLGHINFRGIFDAAPKGMYVMLSTIPLEQIQGRVEIAVDGEREWTIYMSIGADLISAVEAGKKALASGFEALQAEAVAADRAWLAAARKPVQTHPFIMANYKRWLLANRLCLTEDGAILAGPRPFWSFSWPRDSSLLGAAFAAAGYQKEARDFVKWHLEHMPESCIQEARYNTDGTPMLLDNRLRQGDNPGFIAWSSSFICLNAWDRKFAQDISRQLYAVADVLVEHRDAETGLMLPEADFREGLQAETISIAVSAVGGLCATAEVARRLGDSARADRYVQRAVEIKKAAEKHLWDPATQAFMQSIKPLVKRPDIAACWGAYPFKVWDGGKELMRQAVRRLIAEYWDSESGGILSGKGTPHESMWFYHTTLLLMATAATGDSETETEILESLAKNVSPQGLVPEQIGHANGHLWGCCYLATSQGCLLLYAYMNKAECRGAGICPDSASGA